MNRLFVLPLLVVVLFVAACQPIQPMPEAGSEPVAAPAPAGGGEELVGTQWLLTSLGGQASLAETNVTARFGEDGRLSGSAGCNNYSTSYTADGSSLTISPQMMSTMMACDEAIMLQESAYLQALGVVASFAIDGESLTLSDASGAALMTFQVQSQGLGGTNWVVTGYNNGNMAVVSPIVDSEITISFGTDGTVSGNSGCNNYTGGFTTEGDTITIGPLASTMMMCDEELMTQEAQFLAALESSATYSVQGNIFATRNAEDAMAVNAIPAE